MSSPFFTALFDPLNIILLFVSVGAGLLAAWWLFPVGLLIWLIMVINLAANPAFKLAHTAANRAPLAQRFQTAFNRVKRAQVNLFNAAASGAARKSQIEPVLEEVNTLVDEAYALCQRMSALENFRLVSQSNANIEQELEQLTAKVENARDETVKEEYQQALLSLQQRIRRLDEATARLDRVEAELASLANDLTSAITDLLQLQSLPGEQASQRVKELAAKLAERTAEIRQV